MTTAATSLLGLALPVTGELSGTWGDTVNNSITSLLDTAVAGTTTLSTDADVTLTTTTLASNQARQAILLCSGARTALRTITAPAASKIYTIINATTGGYSVKLVGVGPTTGLTIPNGASAVVAWNGSDFIEVGSATVGNFTVNGNLTVTGSTTLSGGTANGVAYLNGSKVVTTGSALTFDGTTFGVTGAATVTGDISTTSTGRLNVRGSGTGVSYDFQIDNSDTLVNLRGSRSNAVTKGFVWYLDNSVTEAMRLTSTGLGIGTSSPGAKLDISYAGGTSGNTTLGLKIGADIGNNTSRTANTRKFATIGGANYSNSAYNIGMISCDSDSASSIIYIGGGISGVYDATSINFVTGSSVTSGAGVTKMTLDSSGNLGLGVTPSAWGGAKGFETGLVGNYFIGSTAASYTSIGTAAYYNGTNWIYARSTAASKYELLNNTHTWWNAPSGTVGNTLTGANAWVQAMTLDASGNLLVGKTSSTLSSNGFSVQPNGNAGGMFVASTANSTSSGDITYAIYTSALSQYQFYVGYNGTVYARSTSITGLSDQREKENIKPLDVGLNEVLALQPRRFDWKDGSLLNVAGFVAQEVQTVLPDLVEEYKINDEENRLGLKMGDMVPMLVKAIQEQQAIIETLTARITALEGK